MSFLTQYWYAVELAISETGMNPGDVHINIHDLLNNTQSTNVVDTDPAEIKTLDDCPEKDGNMSPYAVDYTTREARARRLARSGQTVENLEALETHARKSRSRQSNRDEERSERKDGGIQGKTKTQAKADRKLKNKLLKKLGTGRNVRVKLCEVNINGKTVWDESEVRERP